ncbi:RNA polymerase sigma factor [Oceanobacillus halotolerans]|uniref:RNA polymerase sigma factor n=1 Tax=Oceanobacillus halotolerans TaxID=2663380 RepID=UPI0013D9A920|nr:sigma-70 family RNA polymerase sigma factor [Oceanobacillus halotolerans]
MDDNQESIQLLKQIAAGSRHSFDRFYEKHIEFIFRIAFQLVKDKAEAEDICHEVFLEVFQKYHQYNSRKGSVKAWLAVKTRSRSLDRLRKKKPLLIHKLERIVVQEEIGAEVQFLSQLERKVLMEALSHIPNDQREAIYNAYFKERTQKEIAQIMDKPLGTVKSLIRYGIQNLRKQKSILQWVESNGGGEK